MLLVLCLGLLIAMAGRSARLALAETGATETETPTETPTPTPLPVKVHSIDYDDLWLYVDPGDNGMVYYSDKSKKVWSDALQAEKSSDAVRTSGDTGLFCIDISWIKATSQGKICLRGDLNEEIVEVDLPARESKYKVKFDKKNGTLTFTNKPNGATHFQWRKATSYTWSAPIPIEDALKDGSGTEKRSDFCEELEKLRVSGASIYVRIVGKDGGYPATQTAADGTSTPTLDVGQRPGKEIKISITKRANAPKIKINGSKLTVNSTTSMEYSTDKGANWKPASKAMALSEIAPDALVTETNSTPTEQIVWFRKAVKGNTPYSKPFVLTVPKQRPAPVIGTDFTIESQVDKFCLNFLKASRATPYEYTVVKAGSKLDPAKASWKSVVTSKQIALSARTAPLGSTIYVRQKEVKLSSVTDQQLASAAAQVTVSFATPTPSPSPTPKP